MRREVPYPERTSQCEEHQHRGPSHHRGHPRERVRVALQPRDEIHAERAGDEPTYGGGHRAHAEDEGVAHHAIAYGVELEVGVLLGHRDGLAELLDDTLDLLDLA